MVASRAGDRQQGRCRPGATGDDDEVARAHGWRRDVPETMDRSADLQQRVGDSAQGQTVAAAGRHEDVCCFGDESGGVLELIGTDLPQDVADLGQLPGEEDRTIGARGGHVAASAPTVVRKLSI